MPQQPSRPEDSTDKEANSWQPHPGDQGSDSSNQTGHAHQQPGHQDSQSLSKKDKKPKRQKPESHLQKLAKQVQADKVILHLLLQCCLSSCMLLLYRLLLLLV